MSAVHYHTVSKVADRSYRSAAYYETIYISHYQCSQQYGAVLQQKSNIRIYIKMINRQLHKNKQCTILNLKDNF